MSSDPIEVLRRMRDGWAAGQINEDEKAALDAALASLAAPKPESAEAVATLLEGDPYDDSGASGPWLSMEDRDRLARLPPGTKLYTAPPRPEASAPVGVEEMQRRLEREESDHGRTIDQRDAAEDALGRMFQAVTGRPAEWSSAWGYVDAIEEVEEHVAALAQQPAPVAPVGVEGWAVTKLRPHEARCEACGRAVWDGKDRANCVGFLAPCGKRVARRGDCGTVDCLEALAQQPAAVDEGLAELLAEAEKHVETLHSIVGGEARNIVWKLIVRIRAALAGQQQGGRDDG